MHYIEYIYRVFTKSLNPFNNVGTTSLSRYSRIGNNWLLKDAATSAAASPSVAGGCSTGSVAGAVYNMIDVIINTSK